MVFHKGSKKTKCFGWVQGLSERCLGFQRASGGLTRDYQGV